MTTNKPNQQEDFQERLRAARRQAFSQVVGRLQQASSAAVTTLLRIMTDPAAPPVSRVRAANFVLEHAGNAIELDDIVARLDRLEREEKRNGDFSESPTIVLSKYESKF